MVNWMLLGRLVPWQSMVNHSSGQVANPSALASSSCTTCHLIVVSSFFLQDYISFIFPLVFFFLVFFFGVVVFLFISSLLCVLFIFFVFHLHVLAPANVFCWPSIVDPILRRTGMRFQVVAPPAAGSWPMDDHALVSQAPQGFLLYGRCSSLSSSHGSCVMAEQMLEPRAIRFLPGGYILGQRKQGKGML